jgi:hypothetical protein
MRTDPTNDASPIIKRKFKPLDNPSNVLDVLQGIRLIKEGVIGNNVTTGPLQHRYWRGCLTGTALDKFNEFTTAVGNETAVNLIQVERRLVTFFAPREVLRQQTRYMRFHMRKPKETTTRQYVGAVSTLNSTLEGLPPAFAAGQKVTETDMMDILASKAPKSHKELMTDHGFDPQTATKAEFVEICERAETKEALLDKRSAYHHCSENDDSSDDNRQAKKPKKKHKTSGSRQKAEFYCKEHGPNNTHDTEDCKVIKGRRENKSDWKKKDASEGKYNDYKSKYKKKHRELNLLQMETKKMKAKWTKAYKKIKSKENDNVAPDKDDSSSEGEKPEARARTFTPREHQHDSGTESSSSNSSSSSGEDTDSE